MNIIIEVINMVKIVALSDTHNKHKQIPIPDGDILIVAGDMTGLGNFDEYINIGIWLRKMREKFKYRIMIAGNHDFSLEFNSQMVLATHFDNDVIYLQDKGVTIEGIKFYGTPWMPHFYDWSFMRTEHELKKYYDAIDDDTEVLITHCPPYSILDHNDGDHRCGSYSLYERVKQLKHLKHHIFGHIHHSYGTETIDDVTFHNVASLNESYKYQNPPQVIEIDK